MKKRNAILMIVGVVILTWFISSYLQVQQARNRDGIILSPKKTKSVEFVNSIGTFQVMMNFHRKFVVAGSNVASGNFNENDIHLDWIDENTVLFKYPKGITLRNNEDEIYFFGETVNIVYEELN